MKIYFKLPKLLLLFTFFCVISCNKVSEQRAEKFQIISEIKKGKSSPFYIDTEHYPGTRNSLPIGIFDSGTGGLTVLNSILELDKFNNQSHEDDADGIADFFSERFIYLADEANMPYGKYDAEGNTDFLKELVIKDVRFLLGRKYYELPSDSIAKTDKDPVKAIVIACNTATAFGLEIVQEAVKEWGLDITVIGIIDAGSKSAVALLNSVGSKDQVIGVLATEGTCASNGYPKAIQKHFKNEFQHEKIKVVQQAGIGLAGAIDGDINYIEPAAAKVRDHELYHGPGLNNPQYPIDLSLWKEYNFETGRNLLVSEDSDGNIIEVQLNSVNNYIKYCVTHLVIKILQNYPERNINPVILGCTHYPFFNKEIRDHFMYLKNLDNKYGKIIPEDILLIDPAQSLAIELYRYLVMNSLFGSDKNENSKFYISVPNPLLPENQIDEKNEFPYSYKYGRSVNKSLQFVKIVPFSNQWIDEEIRFRIKNSIPYTYEIIFKKK
ncbi:MAG: aspartate/glutamate racemase family protein [Bacteroidales bacterium]|nr:aspartate/glutamate racemase family protein [Bacteroidales bacterium]